MMKKMILLLFLAPNLAHAQCPGWKPDFKFELEGTDFLQTMTWLSGWSFALHATQAKTRYCLSECGYLDSKRLAEILNEHHQGKTISAEQAAETIESNLEAAFSCE